MKILLTTDWFAPTINGVVTSVLNLRAGLQARGHEVRVLTLSQSVWSAREADISFVSSIAVGKVYPGARFRTIPNPRMKHELQRWHPEIVHSNCEFSTFGPAVHMAEALHIPLVHTYHTVYEDYTHYVFPSARLGRQVVRTLSRRVAAHTDCLIAPTEKTAAILRGYQIGTPIYVVPTGIDLRRLQTTQTPEAQTALRQSLGIPEGNTVLACIGRLAKEKNTEELLHYLTAFRDTPLTLLLVGGGPYQQILEDEVDRLQLREMVIFTGMVPPEQIGSYYRLGDLFVSASTSETQGLTYIEALACGLPLLCRADDCLTSVITDGQDGWQYHNENEFRHLLTEFLEHPERRPALQSSALATAERYSVENFARQMEQVYLQQLAHYGRFPRASAYSAQARQQESI